MSKARLFLDSSALIAGIASPVGGGRALLLLGESEKIDLVISEQVLVETERTFARKIPRALPEARQAILRSNILILPDPPLEEVLRRSDWVHHSADVPILVAAFFAKVDYVVTLNRKHFLDAPQVAVCSGLRIRSPGDALAWVRTLLVKG